MLKLIIEQGDRFFRSAEVEIGEFIFVPNTYDPERMEIQSILPTWFRNPLHDIESIWWIMVWATLHFTETGILDVNSKRQYQLLFFRNEYSLTDQRFLVMFTQSRFPVIYRQPFFANYLISLRDFLHWAYVTMERDLQPVEDRAIYRQTFERFLEELGDMRRTIGPLGQKKLKTLCWRHDLPASLDQGAQLS
jgi:hypothetical protein